jgi:hypothetical protein
VVRRTVLGTVSAATEKAAEEFACWIAADEEFRRASHEMIRRRSQVLLDDLLTTPPHATRPRDARQPPGRRDDAPVKRSHPFPERVIQRSPANSSVDECVRSGADSQSGSPRLEMRGIFDSEQGWQGLLDAFTARASAA